MTNAVIFDEEESLISFFQVGSAFVAEYRRRVKRSGGERAVEFCSDATMTGFSGFDV